MGDGASKRRCHGRWCPPGARAVCVATGVKASVVKRVRIILRIPPFGSGASVVEAPERPVQPDGAKVILRALRVAPGLGAVQAAGVPAVRQAPEGGEAHYVALRQACAG